MIMLALYENNKFSIMVLLFVTRNLFLKGICVRVRGYSGGRTPESVNNSTQ